MQQLVLPLLLPAALSTATTASVASDTDDNCGTVGNATAICGFPAPEDIEVLPDGRHLLLSAFGGMGQQPQRFHLFDTETLEGRPIALVSEENPQRWDDGHCPSPSASPFGSHGIHLSQRDDDRWQVLAVNHDRESVEMFELREQDGLPALAWRGCVVMPEGSVLNDVSAHPEGGFLVSNMASTSGDTSLTEGMARGDRSGHLWRWRSGEGVDKLPGYRGALPNGVAISADGQQVFIGETGANKVTKIDYASGEHIGEAEAFADNFSWTEDGRLLITGISGPMPEECLGSPDPCLAPFQVRAIDPETMDVTVVHEQDGPPRGAGTVAVIHDGYMYVGSFVGHGLLRITLDQALEGTAEPAALQ